MKENKILCIICSILFIMISIGAIVASEIYYYDNNKLANELNKNAITITDGKINSKNNGKLVLVKGKINYNNQVLKDELYDINIKTPKLLRFIEVYQWNRYKEKDENGKTKYVYYKTWSSELIKSKKFKNHDNPKKKEHGTKYFFADEIKVGEFTLSKSQKKLLSTNKQVKLKKDLKLEENYKIYKNYITNSKNPKKPEIGDVRISYRYNNTKDISILAVQSDNSFKTYKSNKKINVVKEENTELNNITDVYRKGSRFSLWLVRIICLIIIFINITIIKETINKKSN